MTTLPLIAGIDAGGTSFKLGVGHPGGPILKRAKVATTTPQETLARSVEALLALAAEEGAAISAVGVAAFGPVDVDPASATYGTILTTPKAGWSDFPLRHSLLEALKVPVHLDTDVNGALAAEMASGAAQGAKSAAYITVGTGIGAGIFAGGGYVGRPSHPEFGHIRVRRHPLDEGFAGICPFHGDCLEGMASGTALIARRPDPSAVSDDDPVWDMMADYLAQACLTLRLTFGLERIVFGGGVIASRSIIGRIRRAYEHHMAGYLPEGPQGADGLIVSAGGGEDAGLLGALTLALRS